MFDGAERAEDYSTQEIQLKVDVEVDLHAAADNSDLLGPELSARMGEVIAPLIADYTLSGAVSRVMYSGSSDVILDEENGGSPIANVVLRFEVSTEHSETSPYVV